MNRRQLLRLVAAVVGAQLLGVTASQAGGNSRFRALFPNRQLRSIGTRCLTVLPADHSALLLSAGIAATDADDQTLLTAFANKREQDFQAGRVHTIDGWVMAESECALCALLALE